MANWFKKFTQGYKAYPCVHCINKECLKLFGPSFLRSLINSFRNGSVVVNSTLVFANLSSVPPPSIATSKLRIALNSTSLDIIEDSINITALTATPNATASPTTALTAAPSITAASTAGPHVTAAPTAAPTVTSTAAPTSPSTTTATTTTTASTNPPTFSEGTLGLTFRLNQEFTSDLSNPSSTAFQTLAASVVRAVNRVCGELFGSFFRRSIVNSFRSGSVVVNMTLVFTDKNTVPSASTATSQLSSALTSTSTSLNIIPGSVSVESTSTSSSSLRPTVGSLAVFSLTLLAVAQILIDL
ncbi:poly(A) polymerase-like [Micropterus dolomieu]|uniref:poly(A) polymerase-like n=1 Tax=Micropterus dolomieu TaxID=147949 RepID=UPI001E8E1617|nr:poly(A) polymerase-like [Micropterus dolomieu]